MIDCISCDSPTYSRQVGRFKQAICPLCEREIRPNGEPVPFDTSVRHTRQRVYDLIREQYQDLNKDFGNA